MQSRQSLWAFIAAVTVAAVLSPGWSPLSSAALADPATVAVASVGVARETGWAIMHVASSRPTEVQITRAHAPERLVAEFMNAVLAPHGDQPIRGTPGLAKVVSLNQTTASPAVVRLEVVSLGQEPPYVERFADCRGLLVRLFLRDTTGRGMPPAAAPAVAGAGRLDLVQAAATPIAAVVRALTAPWRDPSPRETTLVSTESGSPLQGSLGPLPTAGARVLFAALPSRGGLPLPAGPAEGEARAAPDVVVSAAAMTATPPSVLAARPRPEGENRSPAAPKAELERVRVVSLNPLCVAVDCSRPLMYRVEKLDGPPRYVLTFPGAAVAQGCVRSVSLHPAREGAVAIEETQKGARVIIPAAGGELCSAKPGSTPATVLCELARGRAAARVADRPAPEGGKAEEEAPEAKGGEEVAASELLINVDFQDAPVVEILTALARYAERNIITTPAVTGTMSVHLTQVTLTEALDLIVALNGLAYTLVGERNYVVGTAEEIARISKTPAGGAGTAAATLQLIYKPQSTTPQRIAQELGPVVQGRSVTIKILEDAKSMVFMNVPDEQTLEWVRELATQADVPPVDTTRWLQLEHLTPAQAASALQGLTPKVKTLVPGPEAKQVAAVGLTGKTVDVDDAEQILKTIDVAPKVPAKNEEEAVVKTLRVSYADPEAIVTLITALYGEQVQALLANGTKELQDAPNTMESGGLRPAATIVLRGAPSAVAAVEALVAQVDVPPPQVQVSTTITDLSRDKENTEGFTWQLPGLIISELAPAGNGFSFGKFARSALNAAGSGAFQATFDALMKQTNGQVLSRTKLVAVNGKSANFLVGEIVPYETAVAGDGTVTRSVNFQQIGLGLKFSPNVDKDGNVTLFLSPQVTAFTGFSPQGYPIVSTREAQTIVRVRDGDVIVIGGLLRDEELKTLSGIPFLKDIPLFGELFKRHNTTKKKSEVVIFAEVNIIRPGEAPASGPLAEGKG